MIIYFKNIVFRLLHYTTILAAHTISKFISILKQIGNTIWKSNQVLFVICFSIINERLNVCCAAILFQINNITFFLYAQDHRYIKDS